MIRFSFSEICLASLAAFVFGAAASVTYAVLIGIFAGLMSAKAIWRLEAQKRCVARFPDISERTKKASAPFQIFDFVFLLAVCLAFCLLQYILLDGVFRLFFLVFALLPFFLLRRDVMPFCSSIFEKSAFCLLSHILFPLGLLFAFASHHLGKAAVFLRAATKRCKLFLENVYNIFIKRLTKEMKSGKM